MIQVTLTFSSIASAIAQLGKLDASTVVSTDTAAPGKPTSAKPEAAPAPSPRTAKAVAADAPAKNTDKQEPQPDTAKPAAANSAAEPSAADVTAVILKFVPNADHKAAALGVLKGYKQADGSPVTAGKFLQPGDRAAALEQLKALADELDLKLA